MLKITLDMESFTASCFKPRVSFPPALSAWTLAACLAVFCMPVFAGHIPQEVLSDWQLQDGASSPQKMHEVLGAVYSELDNPQEQPDSPPVNGRKASRPHSDEQWEQLYAKACLLRREKRLRLLAGKHPQIIFTKHYDLGGSHYAYTEGQSDAQNERHFTPGASLCLLRIEQGMGTVETLLDDPTGVIRDPDVSRDGKRVLFSWKKSLDQDDYHLYEMTLADRSTRQITFGLGFADYEGVYLPNGDILFNSTRCVQTVDCFWTEVSNLYTCGPDGRFLRRITHDQVHTNYPTVTWDGRVVYTRWDYNDRGQIYPQGLFQMRPDGTAQTECYGNNSWFPTAILHARAIPGTTKLVAVFSGHHTIQKGWLGLLDPSLGRQENAGAQLVAPVRPTASAKIDAYGQKGDQFQYPYPINGEEFIVAFKPANSKDPFGLYWMHKDGRRELLAWDHAISCNQPVPIDNRPVPHETPTLADYQQESGAFFVQDVHHGPGLQGVARGTISKLRVVALHFRAAGAGYNTNKGEAGAALASTPVSIEGTWDVKEVLGTVPVAGDGSAFFKVPARTPVYFQALNEHNEAVQTMRSWAQVQPGEVFSCAGCHESKNSAPPVARHAVALKGGPRVLEPVPYGGRGFSFHREIQPILDKHCVQCHFLNEPDRMVSPSGALTIDHPDVVTAPEFMNYGTPKAGKPAAFSLQGAPGTWSPAYRALANRRVTNWINVQSPPQMLPPHSAGAAKSPLMRMLREGHNGVVLSPEELERIACWIDLLVPCFGEYTEGLQDRQLAFYNRFLDKRKAWQRQEADNIRALLQNR